jgi:response regulator RpfG family c-di-GMP phosphodiesterase
LEQPLSILCVDDEDNILKALNRLFRREPFRVLTANSGEEGLEILQSTNNIGLILSDQRMPGMNGTTFLQSATALAPDTPRLILTGYADVHAAIEAINQGRACRFLTKPWDDDEVRQAVRDELRRYLMVQENFRLSALVTQQNEELAASNSRLEEQVFRQTAEIRRQYDETLMLNRRLKSNYDAIILSFSDLMELRHHQIRSHSRHVSACAVRIARLAGVTEEICEQIRVAAILHDIGKIGISDLLLAMDPENMTPGELREYQLHSVRGQTAIDSLEELREVGVLIRHHHEAYDGSGYPDGLTGSKIPLGSRIIALANHIANAVSRFRGEDAHDLAIRETLTRMGTLFDPQLAGWVESSVRESFAPVPQAAGLTRAELAPQDLVPGMILSRDLLSGSRVLILQEGTKLSESEVTALQRTARNDPFRSGIGVLIPPVIPKGTDVTLH